ncbi:MAG: MotA/TolQ/ExbB proton channel family protein [Pseudomonadota bacterium]
MRWLEDQFLSVRDFMEAGGPLLKAIAVTIFVMWFLIVERTIFYRTGLPKLIDAARAKWEARSERRSWNAHRIREAIVSEVELASEQWLSYIKTLVALCPLLGLMGTVTGMIRVFEVMALSGSGNVRSMADGVSSATIPTMAGMVGALSGVLLITILTRRSEREIELLEDSLTMDH